MPNPEPLLLIIEDDEAFARTLSRSFERRGYRVLARLATMKRPPSWRSTIPATPWST